VSRIIWMDPMNKNNFSNEIDVKNKEKTIY
jgi:hypothetical protein